MVRDATRVVAHSNNSKNGATLHPTTCTECGNGTVVPFVPDRARAIYCEECLRSYRENHQSIPKREDKEKRYESVFSSMDLMHTTRSVLHAMGITDPTPIQEKCIPILQKERDLIGQNKILLQSILGR